MMEHLFSIVEEVLSTSTALIVTSAITLAIILVCRPRSRPHLPPGPPGLPIIGNLHQHKKPAFLAYDHYFKQYGPIFYFRIGQRPAVIVSSLELLKTSLNQHVFSGRLKADFQQKFIRNSGVLLIDGEKWKFHRRLSLQILRDFGMGKSLSESIVQQEVTELCHHLDKFCDVNDGLVDTGTVFSCATMNIISLFVLGERPGYENAKYIEYMNALHSLINGQNLFANLPMVFPFLNAVAPLYRWLALSEFMKKVHIAEEFVLDRLREHRQRMPVDLQNEEPSNYLDAYYLSQKNNEKKMSREWMEFYYNDWQVFRLTFELYAAGMDTSSTTLCWTILLLGLHDEVRSRMVEEIHSIIGKEKVVSMEDRKHFHYCQAVIDEILRWSCIAPVAVHRAMEDSKIGEYDVPKDTLLICNIYSVHHDSSVWEKPHEFYPQHFLSEDGATYRPREHLIPFGIGKRSCLGESLARIELFIFIITLVQRYRVRVELDEENGETLEKCLEGTDGIVRAPGPHKVFISKLMDV